MYRHLSLLALQDYHLFLSSHMLFEKIHLEEDEEVIIVVRKHWFILLAEAIGVFLLTFIPIVGVVIWSFFPETTHIPSFSNYSSLYLFGSCLWIVMCIMIMTMIWTHYYLDLWVITDRRIIVVDQVHFFNRKVSSFRLERLQDIKVRIAGIIQTFLNFGTIKAQTASSAESNFATPGLPDPRGLQSLIQRAMDERLKKISAQMQQVIDS